MSHFGVGRARVLRRRPGLALLLIARLLPHRDRLLPLPELHEDAAAGQGHRQVLLAKPPDQVEGRPRGPLTRQRHRVARHSPLDRLAHLRRRPEESIGRNQPADPLVRPAEVVRLDKQPDATLAVRVVRKYRAREKLLPQRLPEALDLSQRLRMVRTALQVLDPLTPKLLAKFRLATPGDVLAPLVREHLARRPVLRDPSCQSLHHQRRALMVRDHQRHQVPRVVVHERGHVQPLVSTQQKREDVRLPQLIRLGALKGSLRRLRLGRRRGHCLEHPFLVQNPPHRLLSNRQVLKSPQLVTDPSCATLRVIPSRLHHRFARLLPSALHALGALPVRLRSRR